MRIALKPVVLAAAAAVVIGGAAGAAKQAPYENNDTAKAAKPVRGGKTYTAAIERIASPANTLTDDADWFSFKAKRTTRVTVTFTNVGNESIPCFGPVLQALDARQKFLKYVQPANGKTQKLRFKAKRGRSYLEITPHNVQQCDTPKRYSFKIRPAQAIRRP